MIEICFYNITGQSLLQLRLWRCLFLLSKPIYVMNQMEQKGIDLNHDFYVVVGKQYRTEKA